MIDIFCMWYKAIYNHVINSLWFDFFNAIHEQTPIFLCVRFSANIAFFIYARVIQKILRLFPYFFSLRHISLRFSTYNWTKILLILRRISKYGVIYKNIIYNMSEKNGVTEHGLILLFMTFALHNAYHSSS